MLKIGARLALVFLVADVGVLFAQQQVVAAQPQTHTVAPGGSFSFAVRYSTDPQGRELPGLGLRVHWDSQQLSLAEVADVFPTGLLAQGLPEADGEDFDGDPQTDSFIHVAWADLSGGWPGADPTVLLRPRFTTTTGFRGATRIRFSASSTARGFVLDSAPVQVAATGESGCARDDDSLCLNAERFQVEVEWRDFDGDSGNAQVVPVTADDSGLFWFFAPENWEMLVKVLDGCRANDRFWVFAASTTNVEYTLKITDTSTGIEKRYVNPLGRSAAAVADTDAFATCSANGVSASPRASAQDSVERSAVAAGLAPDDKQSDCSPAAGSLCLNQSRFRVEIDWRDFQGNTGSGQVVPVGSDDSGLFWFFAPENWEILVKVLDGCSLNSHFWVFAAATTTVEYTLRVTDTETGSVKEYVNELGTAADAITDTQAFSACP